MVLENLGLCEALPPPDMPTMAVHAEQPMCPGHAGRDLPGEEKNAAACMGQHVSMAGSAADASDGETQKRVFRATVSTLRQ